MDKINPKGIRSGGAHLTAPPYSDEGPIRMSRTVGKGKGGTNFPLTNRAKYGLNEGQDVVRMSRKGGSSAGGSTFNLTHTGPTRMSRSPKGSTSHDSTDYGVGGVTGNGGTGYGVGGK